MTAGTVQTVIVCTASTVSDSTGLCPVNTAPHSVSAYLIQPDQSSLFDAAVGPFDFGQGALFWSTAFVFTLTLYIGSRIYGHLISMVR